MISKINYAAAVAAVALLLSLGAFAKDSNSGNFNLAQKAKVGTAVLQPGHYKAEWTGPENALQISIVRHGATVATVKGKLKELPKAAPYSSVTMHTAHDQSKRVEQIQFNNRKDELVFPTV